MENVARARELTSSILELTRGFSVTGEADKVETEVAAYVELIEAREPLVQELMKLEIDEKSRNTKEFQVVKQNITSISELDKMHMEFAQEMHETIRDTIKLTKQGQRINKGYQAFAENDVLSRFDIKQ